MNIVSRGLLHPQLVQLEHLIMFTGQGQVLLVFNALRDFTVMEPILELSVLEVMFAPRELM